MSYVHPDLVISPKGLVSDLKVLYDGGEDGWSLAKLKWDGNPVLGMRWNGSSENSRFPGIGNPQSRGVPTWFVLPEEVGGVIIEMLKLNKKISSKAD